MRVWRRVAFDGEMFGKRRETWYTLAALDEIGGELDGDTGSLS
jgi:hypothetical protein